MKHISLWILAFAILSLIFIILIVFLSSPFPLLPLMKLQDVFDILTPLVLIPIYWILFKYSGENHTHYSEEISFTVLASFWVLGQGMHLTANSINNLLGSLFPTGSINATWDEIFRLTLFYDEYLGHYLWHIGVLGLAALLIAREWRRPAGLTTTWWATVLSGVIYGFTLFAMTVEGTTAAWLGLPFSILVTLFGLIWSRKKLGQQPVLAFFFVTNLVALLLFITWGLMWKGFPGFFETGIV